MRPGTEKGAPLYGERAPGIVPVPVTSREASPPFDVKLAFAAKAPAVLGLKRAGTVRFIGMSGTLPNLPDQIAMGVFDVFQIPYSAVEREHEALITAAAKAGAGIVVRGGAAKGAPTEGKHDGVQWARWQKVRLDDLLGGMTAMEFILRFTFTHPSLHTNIVGTINPAHLRHNVDVARQGPLPADVYAEAKRRLDAAGSAPRAV